MQATWKLGTELSAPAQRDALSRFVHRMTHENVNARPEMAAMMYRGGYRLSLISDAEWLGCTRFAVTKAGKLDGRVRYCSTNRMIP